MVKEIYIREMAGINRFDEYIRVAVPCAQGDVLPNMPLRLIDPAGKPQPFQFRVLKQWPDGSSKWLLLDCVARVPAGGTAVYRLVHSTETVQAPSVTVQVAQDADSWEVDTGAGSFIIDARIFRPFVMVQRQGDELLRTDGSGCILTTEGDSSFIPIVEDICLEDNGPLRSIVRLSGRFELPLSKILRFSSRLHFFAGSMTVQVEFTLHNPQAARHPNGLWDLGDLGSILFRELAFAFPLASGTVTDLRCVPQLGASPHSIPGRARLALYQESSGGENWQSPAHRNREGRIPLTRRGYVIEIDGDEFATGLRASPFLWCGTNEIGVAVAIPYFWQEFPNEIVWDDKLNIALFPARFPDLHELQGGEQKTSVFYLDFAANLDSLAWALAPLRAVAAPRDYQVSGIFLDLPSHDDLVDQFATVADIFQKREMIDEYGWRNFGEIYADHESAYHQGEINFVSHYNNQYDFCAGAYRKFFATGDFAWGELAADLARHVLDIDIYHTNLDREEYNQGLFWHTDHYIDASLSNHRSFSIEHLKTKSPQFCGGGPGAEHCYTTGLMFHYFQTGNPDFKQAVISLAEWVLRSLDGPQTLLAAMKRGADYISLWRSSKGRKRLFPRYPLTRGTGNAITACLDAFEIGGDRTFLHRADELIRKTLHPEDDIDRRNLLEAEISWSYTVLLVAVAKYLDKKCELGEYDADFAYARASFLAYAEWMLRNEYPYLEKPEILEYPNETWPAQDLRKSVIFFHASRYALPDRKEAYRLKGRFFFTISLNELLRHESSRFARPLVLMLQNGWAGSRLFDEVPHAVTFDYTDHAVSGKPTPFLTLGSVTLRICSDVLRAMRQTSVKRELAWLRARLTN